MTTPLPLTAPLSRQLVKSASNPWYRTLLPVLASAVLMTWVGIAHDTAPGCSAEAPCAPDHAASIGFGLLLAAVAVVPASAAVVLVAGIASMTLALSKGALNPTGSSEVYATISIFLGTLAWAAVREHRTATAPKQLLLDAGAPTAPVPTTLVRGNRGTWRSTWSRRTVLISIGLVAAAVALIARGVALGAAKSAEESEAPVVPAIVTKHVDEFVISVVAPGAGGTRKIDTIDASQYPVGSLQEVWALPSGDLRLLAEPYDSTVLETPASIALAFAAALFIRTTRSRRELVHLRTRPQPVVTVLGDRLPDSAGVLLFPHASEASTSAVVLLPSPTSADGQRRNVQDIDHGRENNTDQPSRSLEPVTCYGAPAPGQWVVTTWPDGTVDHPVRAETADDALPAGAAEDADNTLLRVYSRDEMAPQDVGRVATSGEHRAPRWVQVLAVSGALLFPGAAAPLLDQALGWAGTVPKLAVLGVGLMLLGSAWRQTILQRLTWDAKGIRHMGTAGPLVTVPWQGIDGAFVDGSVLNITLVPEPDEPNDAGETDETDGSVDAEDELDDDGMPAEEYDLRTVISVRAANPRLRPLSAGWRTPTQLRAVLLAARERAVTSGRDVRDVVPVHSPGPKRPWALWLVWGVIAVAVLVYA